MMFLISISTADSPNFMAAILFIVFSFSILMLQIYIAYRRAEKPERERKCKDYSKDFAELCLRFEVIPPPKPSKRFNVSLLTAHDENGNLKRVIGKKVLIK